MRSFTLPVRVFQRRCVAWDHENPATGFRGRTSVDITLTAANTVIACMHPGNYCRPDGVSWGPDSPFAWWTRGLAHLPRIRRIIDERIAPLLRTARSSGIRVIYLVEGWSTTERYPQYRDLRARVPEHPVDMPRCPDDSGRREILEAIYGPGWLTGDRKALSDVMDISPAIAPEAGDWVAATTAQAATVLAENGIVNILYTGFDANGCVWMSAGGMRPMSRLGYRTILLRDCTAGAETAETFADERLTEAWIQVLEMLTCTADSRDLLAALAKV
jgi:nicotinamidase-related amidase